MFTLKDLKHLEVMADLINAQPIPEKQINIKELLDSDPKELTVDEKILSLCSKLRQDGFEKQADGLEDKFISYKSAATHLYRAHDEDGEDLVNAAHPDGDLDTGNGGQDLGIVETIVSQHEKIKKVVNKEPTGKLGNYVSRVENILNKKAQIFEPLFGASALRTLYINFFGNITEQAKEASSILDLVLQDADMAPFTDVRESIHSGSLKLTELASMAGELQKLLSNSKGSKEEINNLVNELNDFKNNELANLITAMKKAQDTIHETADVSDRFLSGFWHDTHLSEAINITSALSKSILKLVSSLQKNVANQSITPEANSGKDSPQGFSINHDAASGKKNEVLFASVSQKNEISKLNQWKSKLDQKQMDPQEKAHIKTWVDGQIKELQNAKSDEEVAKVIAENQKFEAKGLI